MTRDEKQYEQVGNIRIKQPKVKKNKKKKSSTSETPFLTKVFVWIMIICFFGSFILPLAYYFYMVVTQG